jgi:hypothetical protein
LPTERARPLGEEVTVGQADQLDGHCRARDGKTQFRADAAGLARGQGNARAGQTNL